MAASVVRGMKVVGVIYGGVGNGNDDNGFLSDDHFKNKSSNLETSFALNLFS